MIQPALIPKLVALLADHDPFVIRSQFQVVLNELPSVVVPANANFREEIYWLMTHAYGQSRIDDFVVALKYSIPNIAANIEAILAPPGHNAALCPTDEFLVAGHIPFFNRRVLRARLKDLLAANNTRKVVVVQGESITGKTYSGQLISYVGIHAAGARIVWAKLTEVQPEFKFEPWELMDWIVEQLHLELSLPASYRLSREQDSRTIQKLVNWFAGVFPPHNLVQPVWLIVDDLNFPACPSWVFEFMIGLADRLARHQLRTLTVFLIGFQTERLPSAARFLTLADEAVAPTPDDLWEFLVAAASRRGVLFEPASKPAVLTSIWSTAVHPLKHEDFDGIAARAHAFVADLGSTA